MDGCKVKKAKVWNLQAMREVAHILYDCGKDMARRYDLHHWENGRLKSFLIAIYTALRAEVYLVADAQDHCVATYQLRQEKDALHFSKLATSPYFAGRGVGSFCLAQIEQTARERGCVRVCMEVYEKSAHATEFYTNRGYVPCGTVRTRKYTELKMQKMIEE